MEPSDDLIDVACEAWIGTKSDGTIKWRDMPEDAFKRHERQRMRLTLAAARDAELIYYAGELVSRVTWEQYEKNLRP